MQARSLEELFDPETAVEKGWQHLLAARSMASATQRETTDLKTPRADLQFELGAATGHRGFDRRRRAWLDAWAFTFTVGIMTEVKQKPGDLTHEVWRSRIRIIAQYASEQLTETILPYHTLTQIQDAGTTNLILTTDDCHVSELRFTGIVSIRSNAWPVAD